MWWLTPTWQTLWKSSPWGDAMQTIGMPGNLIGTKPGVYSWAPALTGYTVSGNPVSFAQSESRALNGLRVYGWSKRDGTPAYNAPVPIVSAGSVVTTGAQLFPNQESGAAETYKGNCTVTCDNGVYTYTATSTSITIGRGMIAGQVLNTTERRMTAEVRPNTTYTVSYLDTTFSRVVISYLDADYVGVTDNVAYSGSSVTFTTPDGCYRVLFRADKSTTAGETGTFRIMLNEGETALEWEQYTGGVPAVIETEGEINVAVKTAQCLDNQLSGTLDARFIRCTAECDNGTYILTVTQAGDTYVGDATNAGATHNTGTALFIPVEAGKTYTVSVDNEWCNKNFVSYLNSSNVGVQTYNQFDQSVTVTVPTGCVNLSLRFGNGSATLNEVIKFKVMVNEGSTALPWQPYQSQTLPVSVPGGLPGLKVSSGGNYTDASGQQWICDEIDLGRGKYIQRIGRLTITEFNNIGGLHYWETNDITEMWALLDVTPNATYNKQSMCDTFTWGTNKAGGGYAFAQRSYFTIPGNLTADEWKAQMAEISPTIFYVLATPVETDLTAEEIAAYKALRTESPTTTVSNDAGAWMDVGYKN